MKEFVTNLAVIVLLFMMIFRPPLVPYNLTHLFFVLAVVVLFMNGTPIKKLSKSFSPWYLVIVCFFCIVYFFTYYAIYGGAQLYIKAITEQILFVEVMVICIVVAKLLNRLNWSVEKFVSVIVIVCFVQAAIAIAMLMNQGVKDFFINMWLRNGNFLSGGTDIVEAIAVFRMFGFGISYTSTLAYALGIASCFIVFLVIRSKNYWWLVGIIPLLLAGVINARTSLFIFPLAVLFLMHRKAIRISLSKLRKILLVFVIIVVILSFIIINIDFTNSPTFAWINSAYEMGTKDDFFDSYKSMYFMPDSAIGWLLGTGEEVYGRRDKSTDVGYLVDIFTGGLIFEILWYGCIIAFIYKAFDKKDKRIALVIILALLFLNFKGAVFRSNDLMTIGMLISTFAYYRKIKRKNL
ncbi:MAG: hypothetical protein WCP79_03000 [Bacillota bacterium]